MLTPKITKTEVKQLLEPHWSPKPGQVDDLWKIACERSMTAQLLEDILFQYRLNSNQSRYVPTIKSLMPYLPSRKVTDNSHVKLSVFGVTFTHTQARIDFDYFYRRCRYQDAVGIMMNHSDVNPELANKYMAWAYRMEEEIAARKEKYNRKPELVPPTHTPEQQALIAKVSQGRVPLPPAPIAKKINRDFFKTKTPPPPPVQAANYQPPVRGMSILQGVQP